MKNREGAGESVIEESFTDALNRRDRLKSKRVEGIDEPGAAAADRQVGKRPKMNEATVKSSAGIDDSDAEQPEEPSGDKRDDRDFAYQDESWADQDAINEAHSFSKRKRLHVKSHPSLAPAYPKRALLKMTDFKLRRFQVKEAKRLQDAKFKKVRSQAVEMMAMQPPSGAFDEDEWTEPGHIINPHPSHRIAALHGKEGTIFCKRCGCWASKVGLRLLAEPCHCLKESSKHTLRLLECGVMPSLEARIPAHLKLRHASRGRRGRKARW